MSTAKGTRREQEACEYMQRAGYATYRPATVQFGENDIFGLFDVLAVAPDLPLRAVQVKSNRAVGRRSWFDHTQLWRAHGFVTELWVCHDHEGWRVIRCDTDPADGGVRHRVVYDGRDSNASMGDTLVQWIKDEVGQ